MKLHFYENEVKTAAKNYQDDILKHVAKPLNVALLKVIGFSSRIPLQLTRPGQLCNGCKIIFQSSSLPWIGPQEALISNH
ncbi:unnamed protein product [Nezara viridula]|uniref:Uncharacterized protein n=1 Tax=Nezara viridula TaxID=85310 RepID=A0A9P0MQR5_NEZVI|nr:unnamed protein product [Nezara viridula]